MNDDERLCSIALTQCPGIGTAIARRLLTSVGSAAEVFRRRDELLTLVPGLRQQAVDALNCPEAFARAEDELRFAEKSKIRVLTYFDPDYPSRLRECDDAPVVLYYRGNAGLNALRVVAIVGTRRATEYGKRFCDSFVHDLAALCHDVLIVSGLAFGIDIHAHRAALAHGLPTVGVLGHGLDRIYPPSHRSSAIAMLDRGGLLTEFVHGTGPDRYNFVSRNRIIAGLSDATIVVESNAKGGSLITAAISLDYHRDCFALPGRADDPHSEGCNRLIRDNKAGLICNAEDFVRAMNWSSPDAMEALKNHQPVQRSLFVELDDDQQRIASCLAQSGDQHINALSVATDIPVGKLAAMLFDMEMKGAVKALAGGCYHLLA